MAVIRTGTGERRAGSTLWVALPVVAILVAACQAEVDPAVGGDGAGSSPHGTETRDTLQLPVPTSSPGTYDEDTVLGFLRRDGRFEVMVGIIERHRPGRALEEFTDPSWPATFLVPTDVAFEEMDTEVLRSILQDAELLRRVLYNHILWGARRSGEISDNGAQSLGVRLEATGRGDELHVEGARVLEADIEVARGIIHVVDRVILPCRDPVLERSDVVCPG